MCFDETDYFSQQFFGVIDNLFLSFRRLIIITINYKCILLQSVFISAFNIMALGINRAGLVTSNSKHFASHQV